jgi:hypothetical protein
MMSFGLTPDKFAAINVVRYNFCIMDTKQRDNISKSGKMICQGHNGVSHFQIPNDFSESKFLSAIK